jgi:hypothetical protein
MGSRTWIKIYPDRWLDGSIREESLEVRAVFIDLLALAGSGRWGDAGVVKLTENHGYSYQDLSKIFGISVRKCKQIISSLIETDRISIDSRGIICITKWSKYQSEYERQRSYREAKKVTPEVTGEVTPEVTDEIEIEKERYIYIPILDFWNSLNIKRHRTLKDDTRRALATALKDYAKEELCTAIGNYAEIVNGPEYFFNYRWTLKDFLKRGIEKFMDGEVARQNYLKGNAKLDDCSRGAWNK